MTIQGVHPGTNPYATSEQRSNRSNRPPIRANVGDQVQVQIGQRLADGRYVASLGDGERHTVQSAMELTAGSTIRATVVAVGEQLELKYVPDGSTHPVALVEIAPDTPADAVIDELASRYAVDLSPLDRAAIRSAMREAPNEEAIAEGGIFLSKLQLPVERNAMQALCAAQAWSTTSAALPAAAAVVGDNNSATQLERLLLEALQPGEADAPDSSDTANVVVADAGSSGSSQTAGADSGSLEDLARHLLNEQDDGALAYSFGTLPVIVANQLVELDLVHFRERGPRHGRDPALENMQRLVMTFRTETLGRIEVVAHSLGDHLSIAISSESAQSNETLESHAAEVRDLVARLGWRVDAVTYQLDPDPARASRRVIEHVLNAETLDRLL